MIPTRVTFGKWRPLAIICVPMIRQRDAAVWALCHIAAVGALQGSRIAAAIEEQDRLLLLIEAFVNRFLELVGKNRGAFLFAVFFAHIDHAHDGHAFLIHS